MEYRKSLILHFDSLDVIDELSNEQIAQLFKAIRDYNLGKEINLDGLMKAIFIPFKNQFDRDNEKYLKTCEKNKEIALNRRNKNSTPPSTKNTSGENGTPPSTKNTYNDNDSNSNSNSNSDSSSDSVYRKFKHLSITVEDFEKLNETYTKEAIDDILDNIENYKKNKDYTNLYLTAKNWLKKETPKKAVVKYDFASMDRNALVDLRVETKGAIQPELRKFNYRLNAEVEHIARAREYYCGF